MSTSKIKSYRVLCGKTQEEMAALLGISVPTYRNKENGAVPFSQIEMVAFLNEVKEHKSEATLDEIFL